MQNCPRCDKNQALSDPSLGILPCQSCQDSDDGEKLESPEFYNLSKAHRIQQQRDDHAKDILQPYLPGKDMAPNPDFLKAYPDRAKDYFSEEKLKKL